MKNTILLSILLMSIIIPATAQHSLEVTVKNIKEAKGSIQVAVFNSEKEFLEKPFQGKIVKATGSEVTVVFEGLPAGDYAVSVIHDENGNGKLDRNFVGMPYEGFGFGNNAMGSFGPPDFSEAKVTIQDKNLKHEVSLRYM